MTTCKNMKRAAELALSDPRAAYGLLEGKTASVDLNRYSWSNLFLRWAGEILTDVVDALPERFSSGGVKGDATKSVKIVTLNGTTESDMPLQVVMSATMKGMKTEFRIDVKVSGRLATDALFTLEYDEQPAVTAAQIARFLNGSF